MRLELTRPSIRRGAGAERGLVDGRRRARKLVSEFSFLLRLLSRDLDEDFFLFFYS
mgnify:CR=1 FL=1